MATRSVLLILFTAIAIITVGRAPGMERLGNPHAEIVAFNQIHGDLGGRTWHPLARRAGGPRPPRPGRSVPPGEGDAKDAVGSAAPRGVLRGHWRSRARSVRPVASN